MVHGHDDCTFFTKWSWNVMFTLVRPYTKSDVERNKEGNSKHTYLSRLYLYRGHHNIAWTLLFFGSAWIPTSLFSPLMNKTRNLFLFCSYCISRSISALLACGNNQSHFRSVNNFYYSSVELIIIKKLDYQGITQLKLLLY